MTRTEIIDLANQLSERKGEKVLSLPTLYKFVIQDIAKRQRFWWRRVAFSFPLVAGTATYDLTQIVTTPSTALTEIALEEITKFTIIITSSPYQIAELVPTFDPEALIDMINNTSLTSPTTGNTQSPGGRYTMDGNDWKTIRIDPPDLAYTAYIVGWGMPNPASDTTNDVVPMIPPYGHNAIVEGIKAYIFEYVYGVDSPKAIGAMKRYEQAIQDLAQKRQFDPNYKLQLSWQGDDDPAGGAIRST